MAFRYICQNSILKMKKGILLILFSLFISASFAQGGAYKKVKIWFDGKAENKLGALGVDLQEGDLRKGVWFVSDFSVKEITRIQQAGFRTEILIDDVQKFYRERSAQGAEERTAAATNCAGTNTELYTTPSHFYLGGMGGYFTYDQLLDILDSMQLLYPNLITVKQAIDPTTTIEGREIYYVKISDNPNVQEAEPEVLYTAVHHAREAESLSQLVFYMWYLLENYSADTTIKNLVDNTQMFFVPCLNPDGYFYNQFTDPNGGGMWRKNRRDNLDGTFGVDLNRNYGYEYAFDDIGSSPVTADETYRGTAAFSEPETQAISNFTNAHEFRLCLNYHTFGNHLVQPWGFIPDYYPVDSLQYYSYGYAITEKNDYHVGTPNQTVNYTTNGGSDDWMYGDVSGKPKVFAWTPEVGESTDGFWPQVNRIIPLCNENMYANLTMARLAGRYGKVYHDLPTYIAQLGNYFVYDFRQLGLDTTGSITVSVHPLSASVISAGAPIVYSGLNLMQLVHDSIAYNLDPSIVDGDMISFVVTVDNGLYAINDTIVQYYGTMTPIIADDASNLNNWNGFTNWATTTEDFVSPTTSITDSPFSDYAPNTFSDLTLAAPVDLTGLARASVSFDAKWQIEKGFDYTVFMASTDGVNWTPLCGKYTSLGTSSQLFEEPLYDGNQPTWVREEVDLTDYIGQSILLRFEMVSDAFAEFDGFYFDDLTIEGISIPDGVVTIKPTLAISAASPNPALSISNVNYSLAARGDVFEVYNSFGQIVWRKEIEGTAGSIQIPTATMAEGMYTYMIRQANGGSSKVQKLVVQK
jgi:hypothetical protein